MDMTYSQAKAQGQRPVGIEDRVEINRRTDRRTEAIALQFKSNEINLFRHTQTQFTEQSNIKETKTFILCVTGSTQGA